MALVGLVTFLWCLPGMAVRGTFGAQVAVDEPQYLLSATSLWEDLDLDISDELAQERWRAYHRAPLPEQTKPLDGGRRVSPHDPLLPALLAPAMGLGGWRGAKVALALLAGALASATAWLAMARFGVGRRRALVGVGCFALAAPLAVYATQVYPELPAALVVVLGVGALLGAPGGRAATGTGLAVAALPWLSVKYAPVAAALAALVLFRLWRAGRRRPALVLAGALGAAGAAFVAFHVVVYGGVTAYASGDHFVGGELTVVGTSPDVPGRARRLVGLLVDRNFGLVAWQPAWLLTVPALAALARRRPPWWPVVVVPALAGWLSASFVALTMHGYWWPGRQTVVVLPLLAVAVLWWAPTRLLAAGLVIGASTFAWLVAEGADGRITWVSRFWESGAPAHRLARPLLPDLHRQSAADLGGMAVWVAALGAAAVWSWRRAGLRGADEDAAAGEGPDPDALLLDPDRDGAVG